MTYKWTAPADGRYTISLCGSSYDTGLLLYNFTCPTEPSYPEDFICGSDDFCGLQSGLYCMDFSAGQELLIVVDGYGNSAGNYQLNISEYQPSADLDSFIDSTMQSQHIPGLSACAIRDGEVIWSGNYGFANIDQNIEPTGSTLFILASISKTFVGIALMQLWEDGLFELDDDINLYLPWQVQNPFYPDSAITLRMLMTHTSGINDNYNVLIPLYTWGEDSPIPLGEFLENYLMPYGIYYYPTANFGNYAPGSVWNYCNVGAALAGYLVERINPDSLSFEDYCQEQILAPLNMNNSSFFQANLNMDDVAVPYHWDGYSYEPYPHYGYPDYPDGQLRTSVNQLSRYLIAFMQHGQIEGTRILDSTTVELMSSVQVPYPVFGGSYWGLFWCSRSWWGEMRGHSGGDYGARTEMYYRPEENTGVIVLTNGEFNWGPNCILHEIFEYAAHSLAPPCSYLPGDINGNSEANGVDVSYGVNYFKGFGPPPPVVCPDCPNSGESLYGAGDVNANCQFNGVDITYFVNYLKGLGPSLSFCPDCPPSRMSQPAPAFRPVATPMQETGAKIKAGGAE